jgi:hypothetical protein
VGEVGEVGALKGRVGVLGESWGEHRGSLVSDGVRVVVSGCARKC